MRMGLLLAWESNVLPKVLLGAVFGNAKLLQFSNVLFVEYFGLVLERRAIDQAFIVSHVKVECESNPTQFYTAIGLCIFRPFLNKKQKCFGGRAVYIRNNCKSICGARQSFRSKPKVLQDRPYHSHRCVDINCKPKPNPDAFEFEKSCFQLLFFRFRSVGKSMLSLSVHRPKDGSCCAYGCDATDKLLVGFDPPEHNDIANPISKCLSEARAPWRSLAAEPVNPENDVSAQPEYKYEPSEWAPFFNDHHYGNPHV